MSDYSWLPIATLVFIVFAVLGAYVTHQYGPLGVALGTGSLATFYYLEVIDDG